MKKRIALSAVAALAGGLLVAAPASAATVAVDTVNSISLAKVTSVPTTGAAVAVNFTANTDSITDLAADDTVDFKGYLSTYPAGGFAQVTADVDDATTDTEIYVAGGGTAPAVTESASGAAYTVTLEGTSTTEDYTGNTVAASATVGAAQFSFTPAKAGDYVLSVWNDFDGDSVVDIGEAVQTIAITVSAAAGWSQGASTVLSSTGHTVATTTTDAVAKSAAKTLGTYVGTVVVTLKDTLGQLYTGQVVTATVSGVGFVGGASVASPFADADINTADGVAVTTRTASVTDTTGVVAFGVWADGIAGASTVTISVTDKVSGATTVLGSESFTFYGNVATLTVSSKIYTIGKAGGATTGAADADLDNRTVANIPAFVVKATDAAGNVANAAAAPTVISSDALVATGGTCVLDDNADADYSSGGTGFYNCNFVTAVTAKSGDKATLTIRIVDPADATKYLTTTYDVTVGGTVSKETLSFDKASYAPGEAMVITRTAVDAAGNPVYDGAAAPAVSFTKAVGGTAPAASTYVGGKKVTSTTAPSVFAPVIGGDFEAYMTSGNTAGDRVSAKATVVAPVDAAVTAMNAKVVSTEATVAALQVTVASVIKSLKVQWWLLKKIAVKVGIKLG